MANLDVSVISIDSDGSDSVDVYVNTQSSSKEAHHTTGNALHTKNNALAPIATTSSKFIYIYIYIYIYKYIYIYLYI